MIVAIIIWLVACAFLGFAIGAFIGLLAVIQKIREWRASHKK